MTHARKEMVPDHRGRVVINVKVKPDIRAKLCTLADEDDRTLLGYVNRVLENHVSEMTRYTSPDD